jgi:hypothetical protein
MPVATVNMEATEHHDLKTLPPADGEEGGFVVLRRLNYGQVLHRRASVSAMKVRSGRGKDFEGEINMMQESVTLYEYANCIVDHNLTDKDGNPLDFKSPMVIRALDPRVGQEIETLIGKMNNFDDEEDEDSGN